MSYDIYLRDAATKETALVPDGHDLRGGTYVMGGTGEAWLNVTYNYYPHFHRVFGDKGIRVIYGMTGADSIPLLVAGIAKLGDNVSDDYWAATEGNAKAALMNLLALARSCPLAIWDGD